MLDPLVTYRMTTGSTVQPFFPGQPPYFARDAELAFLGNFAGQPVPVQAGAFIRIRFDLSAYLTLGQLITNVGVNFDEENGVDPTPYDRLVGDPFVEVGRKVVRQDFQNLLIGALYVLTISVVGKRFKVPFYTTAGYPGMLREIDTTLPITGGPIHDTGTIGLQIPLAIQYGGTGAETANTALDSLSGASGTITGTLTRNAAGLWTVSSAGSGTITGVTAGAGLTGGGTSGNVTISVAQPYLPLSGGTVANLTVTGTTTLNGSTATTPATADNSTAIATTAYVKNQGYLTGNQTITLSGDITGSGTNAITTTLPSINPNVGTFQGITLNAKGQVTGAINQNYAPLASPAFTGTPTAPTPATADSSTNVATTAFVKNQGYTTTAYVNGAFVPIAGGTVTGNLTVNGQLAGNVTATHGTTSSSLAQRFSHILNVVDDFGADPTGTTECHAAIQAALNLGTITAVYIPNGTYLINAELQITPSTAQSIITQAGNANGVTLTCTTAGQNGIHVLTGCSGVYIGPMSITRNVTATSGAAGIRVDDGSNIVFIDKVICNNHWFGFAVNSIPTGTLFECQADNNYSDGFNIQCPNATPSPQWYLDNCQSQENNGIGFNCVYNIGGTSAGPFFIFCTSFGNTGGGYWFHEVLGGNIDDLFLTDCVSSQDGNHAVNIIGPGQNIDIANMYIEEVGIGPTGRGLGTAASNTGNGILIQGPAGANAYINIHGGSVAGNSGFGLYVLSGSGLAKLALSGIIFSGNNLHNAAGSIEIYVLDTGTICSLSSVVARGSQYALGAGNNNNFYVAASDLTGSIGALYGATGFFNTIACNGVPGNINSGLNVGGTVFAGTGVTVPNNVTYKGQDTSGTAQPLMMMGTDNNLHISSPNSILYNGSAGGSHFFNSNIVIPNNNAIYGTATGGTVYAQLTLNSSNQTVVGDTTHTIFLENNTYIQGAAFSQGSGAGYNFYDRNTPADQWAWYATGGVAELWNNGAAGNIISVNYSTGAVNLSNNLTVAGTVVANSTISSNWALMFHNTTTDPSDAFYWQADNNIANLVSTNANATVLRVDRNSLVTVYNTIYGNGDNNGNCGIPAQAWFQVSSHNYPAPSDVRGKELFAELPECLGLVHAITPQRFKHKNAPEEHRDRVHWGFVAQDVKAAMDEAGHEFGGHWETEDGTQALSYMEMIPILWKAVQELSAEVAALRAAK